MNLKELFEKETIKEEQEDILAKIYYDNLYLSEEIPETEEYLEILESLRENSEGILEECEGDLRKKFIEYTENINIKEGLEAENQFKLGFKTAIKIIVEGLR